METQRKTGGNPAALLPILVFLALYLGMGLIFEYRLHIYQTPHATATEKSAHHHIWRRADCRYVFDVLADVCVCVLRVHWEHKDHLCRSSRDDGGHDGAACDD